MWTWYCFSFNSCSWTGSDFVAAHRNDLVAVMNDFQTNLVALAERIKTDFPNYTTYWLDYSSYTGNSGSSVIQQINAVIQTVGKNYGKFINLRYACNRNCLATFDSYVCA